MNTGIFRENDIRGRIGTDLNEETVTDLAHAIGTYFRRHGASCVSLGFDARESSPIFCEIFIEILNQTGLDVVNIGMVPTPLLYFALHTENVSAGVMITGSHNPAEFNGFKICLGKSTLHGSQIQEIKRIALAKDFEIGAGIAGTKDILDSYLNFVDRNITFGARKLKVVVDAGNGIGGVVGVPLYRRLGCEVVELFTKPDGRFPNHHPDPTQPENMQQAIKAVKAHQADLAIAFDGDGDRIGVVDETGHIIWGDELMSIFARSILKESANQTFIAEVKCSQRLFDDIRAHGGNAVMWKVGHSLIKAKMRETCAALAGEMSGHFFFADRYFGFDDAIYAGARILEILSHTEKPLSQLLNDLPTVCNTPEIRIDCPDKYKFEIVTQLTEEFKITNRVIDIDGARIIFENGWGLVRASNTEPILTLRFEADNEKSLALIQNTVEDRAKILIQQSLQSANARELFG